MRKSTVVNLSKINIFHLKINRIMLLLTVLFGVGVLLGAVTFFDFKTVSGIGKSFFDFYIKHHINISFGKTFFYSFIYFIFALIIFFISGASLMGIALVPFLMFSSGFLFGCFSSYLYGNYSVKGIAFNAVIVIPSFLIFVITLVFSAREALSFSYLLSKLTMPKSRPCNLYIDFKNYCGRFLILSLVIIFSVLIDSSISHFFIKFFEF